MDTLDGEGAHRIVEALPQCVECMHLAVGTTACAAFPDGIPDAIFLGRRKHDTPYPGDHGIRFEPVKE